MLNIQQEKEENFEKIVFNENILHFFATLRLLPAQKKYDKLVLKSQMKFFPMKMRFFLLAFVTSTLIEEETKRNFIENQFGSGEEGRVKIKM